MDETTKHEPAPPTIDLTVELEQLRQRHKEQVDALAKLGPTITLAEDAVRTIWRPELTLSLTASPWGEVDINLHLSKGQAISTIKPALLAVAKSRLFAPANFYQAGSYVCWYFAPRHEDYRPLRVTVWIGSSGVCKLVPTGETQPVMKLECSEDPESMLKE